MEGLVCTRVGKNWRFAAGKLTVGVAIVRKPEQLEAEDYRFCQRAGSARALSHFFPGFFGPLVSHHQRPASHSAFHAESREDAAVRFDGGDGISVGLCGALFYCAHGR